MLAGTVRLASIAAALTLIAATGIGRAGLASGLAGALTVSTTALQARSASGDLRIEARSALLIDREGLSLDGGGSIVVQSKGEIGRAHV